MQARQHGFYWPRPMRVPPRLDPRRPTLPPRPRHALLINPFYPKHPVASFAKHMLTPSLALTSVAGATPPGWTVRYWDENLLQGPPPAEPFPQVVGITVHLTFARRAFELAHWYRQRGALVILGGLHVVSCPEECAPHADALAVGEGVHLWPAILADIEGGQLQPRYDGSYRRPYRDDPPPRRALLDRAGFLTTTSRHPRLPQPLRLLLPLHGRVAHTLPDPRCRAGGRGVPGRWPALRRLHRQQPRLQARLPAAALPGTAAAGEDLERGRHHRRDQRSFPGA